MSDNLIHLFHYEKAGHDGHAADLESVPRKPDESFIAGLKRALVENPKASPFLGEIMSIDADGKPVAKSVVPEGESWEAIASALADAMAHRATE